VFIAKDLQPFSVVTCTRFNHLVKRPDIYYTVPSWTGFTNRHVRKLRTSCPKPATQLSPATVGPIPLDPPGQLRVTWPWMFITFWTGRWKVQCYKRSLYKSCTSTHLADEFLNPVNEWKLARPDITIPVTADNAQNIVNAVKEADGHRWDVLPVS